MHAQRLSRATSHAPLAQGQVPTSTPPAPRSASVELSTADALGPWLRSKFVEAFEWRAAGKLGSLPPPGASGTTVAEALGHWVAGKGRKTLQMALQVPPPEPEFLG